MTYAENRRNKGLTRFGRVEEQVSKAFAQVSAQRTGANLGHLAPKGASDFEGLYGIAKAIP